MSEHDALKARDKWTRFRLVAPATRVAILDAIRDYQRDFIERGVEHLKPMTYASIAKLCGVTPSTVSRAIADEQLKTAHGTYEYKWLFTEGVPGPAGAKVSQEVIKLHVKELADSGLSDREIAEIVLSRLGVRIARRTVTKYRLDLGQIRQLRRGVSPLYALPGLRAARLQQKRSQKALAQALSINANAVVDYELGRRRASLATVEAMARVLGVAVNDLTLGLPPIVPQKPGPRGGTKRNDLGRFMREQR